MLRTIKGGEENSLPLINIICEALIEQMELFRVKSLNEALNISGPDYITIPKDFEETNQVPPTRKKSNIGTASNAILKVVDKSGGIIKYEKPENRKYEDISKQFEELIDNYLECNKHLISKIPYSRCKRTRMLYEFYEIINKPLIKNTKDIKWNI